MKFAYTKKSSFSFLETMDEIRFLLSDIWFGIVSQVNISEKINEKIDKDFLNYTVLWVCNPKIAYEFLNFDLELWVFMPCSISIYEKKNEWIFVSIWNPNFLVWDLIKDENKLEIINKLTNDLKSILDEL